MLVVASGGEVRIWCWEDATKVVLAEPPRHFTSLLSGGGKMRTFIMVGEQEFYGVSDAPVRVGPIGVADTTPLNSTLYGLQNERRRTMKAGISRGDHLEAHSEWLECSGGDSDGIIDLVGGKIGGGRDSLQTLLRLGGDRNEALGGLVTGGRAEGRTRVQAEVHVFMCQKGGDRCHVSTTPMPQVSIPGLVAGYYEGLLVGDASRDSLWGFPCKTGSATIDTDRPRCIKLPPGFKPRGLVSINDEVCGCACGCVVRTGANIC